MFLFSLCSVSWSDSPFNWQNWFKASNRWAINKSTISPTLHDNHNDAFLPPAFFLTLVITCINSISEIECAVDRRVLIQWSFLLGITLKHIPDALYHRPRWSGREFSASERKKRLGESTIWLCEMCIVSKACGVIMTQCCSDSVFKSSKVLRHSTSTASAVWVLPSAGKKHRRPDPLTFFLISCRDIREYPRAQVSTACSDTTIE